MSFSIEIPYIKPLPLMDVINNAYQIFCELVDIDPSLFQGFSLSEYYNRKEVPVENFILERGTNTWLSGVGDYRVRIYCMSSSDMPDEREGEVYPQEWYIPYVSIAGGGEVPWIICPAFGIAIARMTDALIIDDGQWFGDYEHSPDEFFTRLRQEKQDRIQRIRAIVLEGYVSDH